jgi:hypothetical protein
MSAIRGLAKAIHQEKNGIHFSAAAYPALFVLRQAMVTNQSKAMDCAESLDMAVFQQEVGKCIEPIV